MNCRKCGQPMSDLHTFVLGDAFVHEWHCFHCNYNRVIPAKATGDALYETRGFSPDAVTEEYEPMSDTQPLPPRRADSSFRGDE